MIEKILLMIVVEIGLNHLGNEKLLKKYIKITIWCGCNYYSSNKKIFLKNNILKFYIEKQRLYNLIFSHVKRNWSIIDEIDENIYN